jgi:hypothetical protein
VATKELVFPSGVNRGLSIRQEVGRRQRYTCPWSLNVRTEDSLTSRLRGSSWTPTAATATVGVVHSGGYVVADPGDDAPGTSSNADCIYRDRFIRPVSQAIYASRQGDYTDWSFSSDISDVQRPFLIQLSEAGELGGDIVALIPHKDNYFLAATSSSLWALREDPTVQGSLQNISRDIGMVGPRAWCRDHLDRYYFLSSHGLYTVGADGSSLQALSEDVIPEELTGVTDSTTVLEYDHAMRTVRIYIPTADVNWLFETEQQGFWPFDVDYAGSHVAIGPIQLNDGETYGRLLRLHGITAAGSADVTWRVLVADTAEQVSVNAKAAIEDLVASSTPANVHSSGTWTAGVNHRSYPRARGLFMILLLSATGDWAWEGAVCFTEPSGKWR